MNEARHAAGQGAYSLAIPIEDNPHSDAFLRGVWHAGWRKAEVDDTAKDLLEALRKIKGYASPKMDVTMRIAFGMFC